MNVLTNKFVKSILPKFKHCYLKSENVPCNCTWRCEFNHNLYCYITEKIRNKNDCLCTNKCSAGMNDLQLYFIENDFKK